MAEVHWIKLKVDMFDNEKIKLIEAMPDADSILVIWIKLLTYAGKSNSSGYIMLTENIAMNEEELATIFSRPLNTVRYAIQIFERYGMIERHNDSIRIKNWDTHQNIEGMDKIREQNRLRKQRQREKQAKKLDVPTVQGVSHGMSRDSHATEEEADTELETDTEIEREEEGEKEVPAAARLSLENYFGSLTQYMQEDLEFYKDKFDELEAILNEAIDISRQRSVKNWNYTKKIIQDWRNHDLKTLSEVRDHENKNKKTNGRKTAGTPNPYQHDDDLPF